MKLEEIDELMEEEDEEDGAASEDSDEETDIEEDMSNSLSLLTDCLDLMEGLMDRRRRNIIGKGQLHKLRNLSAEVRGFLAECGALDTEEDEEEGSK